MKGTIEKQHRILSIIKAEINQYKSVAEHVNKVGMDAYLEHGDWTLLVTLKDVISAIDFDTEYEDEKLRRHHQDEIVKADSIIKKNMNEKQLKKLIELNPDLPIKNWFW